MRHVTAALAQSQQPSTTKTGERDDPVSPLRQRWQELRSDGPVQSGIEWTEASTGALTGSPVNPPPAGRGPA
jgi:hypothetical protein